MFTGIVEATGKILKKDAKRLSVERPALFDDIGLGSSIAVNGCCLTIADLQETSFSFDLTEETLKMTTFPLLREGDVVNLERAMKADARLDGHLVSGHIEGVGEVVDTGPEILKVRIQKEISNFVSDKGSIAIDGVSLTIAEITDGTVLRFAIVPFTNEHTIIRHYQPGTPVNVETDMLARARSRLLA